MVSFIFPVRDRYLSPATPQKHVINIEYIYLLGTLRNRKVLLGKEREERECHDCICVASRFSEVLS